MAPSVVVTGVSRGIGFSIAGFLAAKGWTVFGTVRRTSDVALVRTALGDRVIPLIADVTDRAALAQAAKAVEAYLAGRRLKGLVNNAGIAVGGPLLMLPLEELRTQLEVNVVGVTATVQAFAPLLCQGESEDPPGRIVNITSVAGRLAQPLMGPYAISKSGLEALSDSLRRELLIYGVDVITVAPGLVATPLTEASAEYDIEASPYAGTPYVEPIRRLLKDMTPDNQRALTPDAVAAVVHRALSVRKPRVRYSVVPDPIGQGLREILPKRLVDRMIGRRLALTPQRART